MRYLFSPPYAPYLYPDGPVRICYTNTKTGLQHEYTENQFVTFGTQPLEMPHLVNTQTGPPYILSFREDRYKTLTSGVVVDGVVLPLGEYFPIWKRATYAEHEWCLIEPAQKTPTVLEDVWPGAKKHAVLAVKERKAPDCAACRLSCAGAVWIEPCCDHAYHRDCYYYLRSLGRHCCGLPPPDVYYCSRSRKRKLRRAVECSGCVAGYRIHTCHDLRKIPSDLQVALLQIAAEEAAAALSVLVTDLGTDDPRWRASAMQSPQRGTFVRRGGNRMQRAREVAQEAGVPVSEVVTVERTERKVNPPSVTTLQASGPGATYASDVDRDRAVQEGALGKPYYTYTQGKPREERQDALVSAERFRELQAELKALRRTASHNAAMIRAQAADDSFSFTSKSKYLRSLLLPDEGAVGIPDDVIRLHHLKTETVTYNLTVSESGAGIFIFYPNHPTNLIGYHYISTPAGYVFDTALYTAQDLRDSFDFGKKCSQLLALRSSTLPSGVYALNGTFNAVRVDGYVSEVPGLAGPDLYNTILTNTVEPLDKIGNVLVGDGVAIISLLDSFGQPYTRLGDLSPNTITIGTYNNVPPFIIDRSSDLQYFAAALYSPVVAPDAEIAFLDTTINVDSNTGVEVTITLNCNDIADSSLDIQYTITFLDPFGSVLNTETILMEGTAAAGVLTLSYSSFFGLGYTPAGASMGPLAAIRIQGELVSSIALAAPALMTTRIQFTVPTGARSGINGPINLVAYQGVAPSSVITLSGWTNYMLVPNPSLRQNLPVSYNKVDVGDATWCKTVLGDRRRFELRSVWNLKDYNASRAMLAEFADTGTHDRARALSGSDIIAALKKIFAPAVRAALTEGAKVIPAMMAVAAGGQPVRAIGASGLSVRARALECADPKPLDIPPAHQFLRARSADDGWRAVSADRLALMRMRTHPRAVAQRDVRTVAFPVVCTHPFVEEPTQFQLYVASSVDYSHFHPEFRSYRDGYFVQGYDDEVAVPLNRNVYICPIDPVHFLEGKIRPVRGPVANGHSADAAIWLVCYGQFQGTLPYPITGSVTGELLNANDYFDRKQAYLRSQMLPLAGNSENADIVIENLRQVQFKAKPRNILHAY